MEASITIISFPLMQFTWWKLRHIEENNDCTVGRWLSIAKRKRRAYSALSPGSARQSISSWLPSSTLQVNCVALTPPPANVNIYFTQGRKHFDYLPTSGWQQLPNKIVTRWWRCIFNRLVSTVDFYSPFLLVTKERFLIDAMTSDERDSLSSPQLAIRIRVECVGDNP